MFLVRGTFPAIIKHKKSSIIRLENSTFQIPEIPLSRNPGIVIITILFKVSDPDSFLFANDTVTINVQTRKKR